MEIWEEGARRKRKRREGGRMGKWREGKEERNVNGRQEWWSKFTVLPSKRHFFITDF